MATRDIRAPKADETQFQTTTRDNVTRRPASKVLRRLILAGCLGMVTFGSIGCTASSGLFRKVRRSDCLDEFMVRYRNRVMAEKSWHCRKDSFGANASDDVFKAGFIAGYLDIAEGGEGCVPLVAPREYWGWRYQSAGGQGAAGSWFSGWPMGVQAAEEEGLGTFRQAPHCNSGCGNPVPTPPCGTLGPMPAPAVMDVNGNPFYPDAPVMMEPTVAPIDAGDGVMEPPADLPERDTPPTIDSVDGLEDAVPATPDITDSVSVKDAAEQIASLPQFESDSSDGVTTSFDDSTEKISIEEIFGLAPQEAATVESSDNALPFSFE